MYATIQFIHSYWAYLVLIVLFVAAINAIIGYTSNKEYGATNFRIALFTLITSHIQLLIGIVLYFTSPYFTVLLEEGMGTVMPDPTLRLYILEHPLMMIIAVALITIGYSKHKSKLTSRPKFKTLAIFYTLGLLIMLSRIPWSAWF
jgi:heme A synthase